MDVKMSNYKNETIIRNIQLLDEYIDQVDLQVLQPYKDQIKQLPKDDQKKEWHKYHIIDKCITQALDTVIMLNEDRSMMHSQYEFEHQKRVIAALRKYVCVLGGNPSIINYTTNSDLK